MYASLRPSWFILSAMSRSRGFYVGFISKNNTRFKKIDEKNEKKVKLKTKWRNKKIKK